MFGGFLAPLPPLDGPAPSLNDLGCDLVLLSCNPLDLLSAALLPLSRPALGLLGIVACLKRALLLLQVAGAESTA